MNNRTLPLLLLLLLSAMASATSQPPPSMDRLPQLSERENVQRFIERMVSKHQFEREPLTTLLNQLTLREKKVSPKTSAAKRKARMTNPAESRPWAEYRNKHVKPGIIRRGVRFWEQHRETLARAEKEHGVPAHIIVGILGVETRYGGYMGDDPVINALATFAFNYPKRERFFTAELEAFLLMTREEQQDPYHYLGSYAGAMGMPQFMPSNYRKLAVDFDQDGKKDIWHTPADAIGSIANYLRHHGWRSGEPIATQASYTPTTNQPTEWRVSAGDSLWNISKTLQTDNGNAIEAVMEEIQKLNPHAFINGDRDRLMAGTILKLPHASDPSYRHLILKKLRPKYRVSEILDAGFAVEEEYPSDARALLLELKGAEGTEFWIALHNFYVISRYNPRTLYTMAVFQLGEEIRTAYEKQEQQIEQDG